MENKNQDIISKKKFIIRMMKYSICVMLFVILSLVVGMFAYHKLEGMSWIDSYLNACMILGGMGPVGEVKSVAGKIFAGTYAMYSGFVAIIAVGIMAAPIFHRFLHHFHMEED